MTQQERGKYLILLDVLLRAAKTFNSALNLNQAAPRTDLFGIALQYGRIYKVRRKELEDFVIKAKLKPFFEASCPLNALPWHKDYSYYPKFKMSAKN